MMLAEILKEERDDLTFAPSLAAPLIRVEAV